jgi:hypothetical protein
MTEQPTPPTNTNSTFKPKQSLSDFPECPTDHWIYKRGAQIGFVRGLPPSIKNRESNQTDTSKQE